jgi:hypothetical protein
MTPDGRGRLRGVDAEQERTRRRSSSSVGRRNRRDLAKPSTFQHPDTATAPRGRRTAQCCPSSGSKTAGRIGIPLSGAAPEALTKAPEGAFAYEWSPDGRTIAFITRDPMPRDEERQRQDKSFIMRADAPDRPTRLALIKVGQPFAMRMLTPPTDYVDAL